MAEYYQYLESGIWVIFVFFTDCESDNFIWFILHVNDRMSIQVQVCKIYVSKDLGIAVV